MRVEMNLIGMFLYSVRSRKRILENAYLGRYERKNYKEQGDHAERTYSNPWMAADSAFVIESARFENKRNCRRYEEDRNIYIVGRRTDNAVVGVKQNGNKREPEQYSSELYAPKILAVVKEKALRNGKEKHWEKQKLHMLPR